MCLLAVLVASKADMTPFYSNATSLPSPLTVAVMIVSQWRFHHLIAGYEVAVEEANHRYGDHIQLQLVPLQVPYLFDCQDTVREMPNLVSKYYYSNRTLFDLVIAVTNMCGEDVTETAPLFAEWDILYILAVGTPVDVRNRKKYPTVVSMGASDNTVVVAFAKSVLNTFQWSDIFLMCDTSANSTNAFYRNNCRGLKTTFKNATENRVYDATFDSRSPDGINYPLIFDLAKRSARVIILMAEHPIVRQLMIQAYYRNMTTHEYVYIFMQPYYIYKIYPPIAWKRNDTDDLIVREAYRSMLFITADTDTLESRLSGNSTKEIFSRMKQPQYRDTDASEQTKLPVVMLGGYDGIKLAASVISNVVLANGPRNVVSSLGGHALKERLSNQTFDAPTGPLYVDENGIRVPNYVLKQLNIATDAFENVILYTASKRQQTLPFGRIMWWRGGTPPANEPKCGFNGDKLVCSPKSDTTSMKAGVIVLLTLIVGDAMLMQWYLSRFHQNKAWAFLSPNSLKPSRRRSSSHRSGRNSHSTRNKLSAFAGRLDSL